METTVTPAKRSGFAVLGDTLIAPKAAFAAIREHPTWLIAFVTLAVLGAIGAYLQVPALDRIADATFAHSPQTASLSPEQLAQSRSIAHTVNQFSWFFYPVIAAVAIAVFAGFLALAALLGKGRANYPRLFALSANVGVVNWGLAYLLIGILVVVRGASAFSTRADLVNALPSLAWLVPNAGIKLGAFLAAFNVFQFWSVALTALGLQIVAGLRPAIAWATPIVLLLLAAALGAAFAR